MGKLNQINYGGTSFTNESDHVELTQAQYDALSEAEKLNGKVYFITDGINANVVLNENNNTKSFVTVEHNEAAQLYRAQIAHKDAAGNYVSAINMDYRYNPTTNEYYNQHITQYRLDETLTTDNKWVMVAQYLPNDQDSAWTDVGALAGGAAGRVYGFRRNEWITLALRHTINVDVPAKMHTTVIENMPDRYSIKQGTLDFIVGVSPSSGVLLPAILRYTHGVSNGTIVNKVTLWCEQALTANVTSWFGCITYPAMPRY